MGVMSGTTRKQKPTGGAITTLNDLNGPRKNDEMKMLAETIERLMT